MNGFPSNRIAEKIREAPYRVLACGDKLQAGYAEPLLHTIYVDKTLSGIETVQTLSRINQAHPKKHDAFVLDFLNGTDLDKLHDLQADLEGTQVYSNEQISEFVELYLGNADCDRLDPILDACVSVYVHDLDEDGQVEFKDMAKGVARRYGFLSCILTYANPA